MLTLAGLGVFAGVEGLQSYGVSLATPQIAATLKVSAVSLLSVRVPGLLVTYVLTLAVPALSDSRRLAVRVWTTRIGAFATALVLALTGTVRGPWALVGVLALGALFSVPGGVLQRSMAVPEADGTFRIRALSAAQVGILLGQVLLPLGILAGAATSWHKALPVAGLVGLAAVVIGSAVQRPTEAHAVAPPPADEVANWGELTRSWRATPTMLGVAGSLAAIGLLLMPYDAVLSIYLHQHFHLGLRGVSGVFLAMAATALIVVLASTAYADRLLANRPVQLARWSSIALGVASVLLLVGALLSGRTAAVILIAVGTAIANALLPALLGLGMAVTPGTQRTALAAAATFVLTLGSIVGVAVAVCVTDRYGTRYALVSLAGLGVIAAVGLRLASTQVAADQSRCDEQSLRVRPEGAARSGASLLACQGIDFSYGSLQVLFGVDAHVEEGEIVGLLGTNGAGKSTLLRVISGLGIPQSGSVMFGGRDITYLDAEMRVRIGITQVPGGRAVFRSMNVVENLQSFGYTLGRDRRAVDEAIERCFEAFPRLKERRTSAAAMLSGGEQQMVGLSKALILRPKLLLIDELSLGLAPVIVTRLLDMVRRINADGTAVVIVEQSVTTALSLVDRAYFMEKGEVRFDGPAADLIDRHDLLRAVFLEGAAKGVVA
ncbi:MAG TPA: MFS transporter [Mycobacteriales bacterium]|nr:MFS transporter [Mycobacteriales bacterium]